MAMGEMMDWISKNDGSIAAICAVLALLVSVVAIFLTNRTLNSQHDHNRLSVKPVPKFGIGDYEDRVFVSLKNVGLGPLKVTKFWSLNGNIESKKPLIDLMPELSGNYSWSDFKGNIEGGVIPQNESLMLVELRGNPNDKTFVENRDKVRKVLGGFTVLVNYTDLYEKDIKFYMETLEWFHRH